MCNTYHHKIMGMSIFCSQSLHLRHRKTVLEKTKQNFQQIYTALEEKEI